MEEVLSIDKNGNKRRKYQAFCSKCGCDRGFKRKNKLNGVCRSCSQIHSGEFPSNVDKDDYISKPSPTRKFPERVSFSYKTTCLCCKKDKGYIQPKDFLKPCLSCAAFTRHKNMSSEKKNLIKSKLSKPMREEIKQKIREKLTGVPTGRNIPTPEIIKIKISATKQKIKLEEFKEFKCDINTRQRKSHTMKNLRNQCFENANFTCDIFKIKNCELNAHHLESWDNNEEGRFELDNLVCLSEQAHKLFHKKYGKGGNTKEQYQEFKNEIASYIDKPKQDLYLVAGAPASGKSWVCSQLKDKFNYVSYDHVSKHAHIYELLKNNNKPLLFDPTIKISTFIKRISHLFNIKLIVIVETEEVINQRMVDRGGKITNTIQRRIKRMNNLSKKCEFSGTSSEVFNYLNKLS